MTWNSYFQRHLRFLWSSYFLLLLQHTLVCVWANENEECLQIFQCPELTSDLLNLTAPDFAAKYHLKCSRHNSGHQEVCCPMQNPSLNTIIQDEYLERTQSPFVSTKTLIYTEFSTVPQIITETESIAHTITKIVSNTSTKIQIKVTTVTSLKENTKTKIEKEYETSTTTITRTTNMLTTKTIRVMDIQYDTKEITRTETIYITDTFTESVPVTQIYVRTSKLEASTTTVTLPPVTTTVLLRSTVKRRPITRYLDSPFLPVMHRSVVTSTITPDLSLSGPRLKKHSHQQHIDIPDGFIELFGRVVLLPKTGDPLRNWTESIEHCQSFNSKPFVPKSTGDWTWLQDIAKTLDDTMWIPASDIENEGSIIWADNTVASQNWISWWQSGGGNREADDCMLMWNTDSKVEMVPCSYTEYSFVCQY